MENLEERLLKLEAENIVARELIRALIGMTKPHPIGDAPLSMAVREINGVAQSSPEHQAAIAQALQNLDPYKVSRSLR